MTVGELLETLTDYDMNAKVYIRRELSNPIGATAEPLVAVKHGHCDETVDHEKFHPDDPIAVLLIGNQ